MNNQMQKYNPVHIIIFFDNSKIEIDQTQKNALLEKMSNPNFKTFNIGENIYHVSQIAKVLTLEEFYREYPDERPEKKLPTIDDIFRTRNAYKPINPIKLVQKPTHVKSMIRGYERAKIETHGKEKWETLKKDDSLFQKMLRRQKEIELFE